MSLLIALMCLAFGADHVELKPGVQYDAGTRVGSTSLGVSFVVPKDWLGTLPQGADAMVLGSHTQPGMVMVIAEPGMDAAGARQALSEPVPLDMMTVMQPTGQPTESGGVLAQRYTGPSLVGHARAVVAGRSAIAFLAMGPEASSADLEKLATTLVASVKPVKVDKPSGALASRLAGNKLYYLKVSTGFSSSSNEKNIYLCSDGTAIWDSEYGYSSSDAVSDFSMAGQNADRGTWTVSGTRVIAMWPDGSTTELDLVDRGDSIGIAQDNWWVQPQQVCP